MAPSLLQRIPVVAGLGYIERVRSLSSPFTATLAAESDNRYFPHAIAVLVAGQKVGYVAPEVALTYYEAIRNRTTPATCEGRNASLSDHETSGVELLLDFSKLSITSSE